MQYITDQKEITRILGRSLGEPVYKSAGRSDENGNEIVVPVFMINIRKEGEQVHRRLKEILHSITGAVIVSVLIWALLIAIACLTAQASGPGYDRIEQTENKTVIELTERVAEIYPVCPELLQAQIFYESSNRMSARSGKCIGYMQVSTKYHGDRADKLGVSLYDGYGNILTGADYLVELCERYGDVATALMIYNGTSDAVQRGKTGNLTDYARNILELSEKLERRHGK